MPRLLRAALVISFAFVTLLASGCNAPTITEEWSAAPATPNPYRSVLVVRIAKDPTIRRTAEDAMVAELSKLGVAAKPSYEYLEFSAAVNAAAMRDAVARAGTQAALVVRPLYRTERVEVNPGVYQPSMGSTFYEDFSSAWGADYYEPPTIETYEVYTFEATLFDTGANKLVWSGLTKSENPARTPGDAAAYAKTIVASLRQRDLL